jgi:uncharacterized membrane protein YgcG
MRSRSRVLLTALGVAAVVVAPALPAAADVSDFEFELFDADYTLTRAADGTARLTVVETLVAEFPDEDQNRGIIRALPRFAQRVDLAPTVQSIVDDDGDAVVWEETVTDEFLELALGTDEFVHGETTYVITYTEQHVVGAFDDTAADEFYRDVNGTGFDQPFGTVSARLRLDADLAAALTGDAACYRGELRSTDTCTVDVAPDAQTGGTLIEVAEDGLAARETVTVAVGFAEGTFVPGPKTQPVPREPSVDTPAPWWSNLLTVLTVLGSIGAIGAVVGAVVARVRRGSGARGRGTIIPQYSVPDDLNVMVAAHLLERGSTAVPAQLVSLAVRGNLRILDYPVGASGAEYSLQFVTEDGADDLERRLLAAVFGASPVPGQVRELAPADATLGAAVNAVSAAAADAVTTTGLRAKPRSSGFVWVAVAVAVGALAVVNQVATIGAYSLAPWPLIAVVLAVLALVVGLAVAQYKNHLTPAGAETRDYLRGMRVYLQLAEQERFRMLQSPEGADRVDVGDTTQVVKLYERLLPFAVIWGVEDEWAEELEVRSVEAGTRPDWFVSQNAFSAYALTSAVRGTSTAASYTPPSSWSSGGSSNSAFSSGFGGSGGGGFAGGGGGGGGGGGR